MSFQAAVPCSFYIFGGQGTRCGRNRFEKRYNMLNKLCWKRLDNIKGLTLVFEKISIWPVFSSIFRTSRAILYYKILFNICSVRFQVRNFECFVITYIGDVK